MASTKVKINYDLGDNKTASRTISNINPEATVRENLRLAALLVQNYRSFG